MGENLLHQPGKYSRLLLELRVALSNKNQFDSWFLYYTSNNDAITFININMHKNPYVNLPCRVDRNAITKELTIMIRRRKTTRKTTIIIHYFRSINP